MTTFATATAATTFAIRDDLAALLEQLVQGDPASFPAGVKVYREQPDALVPPAYVVAWEGCSPAGEQWGIWATEVSVECWPATDLTDQAHVLSRDQLVTGALGAVAGAWQPDGAAVNAFGSALETAQLGQQPVRIAVVRAQVHHAAPC